MAKKIWGGKKITEIIKDAEAKREQLNTLFEELQQTATRIKVVADGADKTSESASANAASVESTLTEVRAEQAEISQLKGQITELKVAAEELVQTNEKLATESKEQLAVIAGGSLSNTFEKRREVLGESARKWFFWLLADIAALIVIAFIVFTELRNNQELTTGFFLKFSLSFPFIYAAFFFHGQYRNDKDLEEEYAFKSAVSFSMNAYRKLLNEEIDSEKTEEQSRLLDFITDTIKRLYTPPRRELAYGSKKGNLESSGLVGELKDILKTIKEFNN